MTFLSKGVDLRDYDEIDLLLLFYDIEDGEKELESKVASLQQSYNRARKSKSPLGQLLVPLLITLFLTSSCTVHAGNLMGFWSTGTGEEMSAAQDTWSAGVAASVADPSTDTYWWVNVLVKEPLILLGLPFWFSYGFLEAATWLLGDFVPQVMPVIPYIELGVVLIASLVVVSSGIAPLREKKRGLKDIKREMKEPQGELKRVRAEKRRVGRYLEKEYGWTDAIRQKAHSGGIDPYMAQVALDSAKESRAVKEQLLEELFSDVDVDGDSEEAQLYRELKRM